MGEGIDLTDQELESELARRRAVAQTDTVTAPAPTASRPRHLIVSGVAVAGLALGAIGPWAKALGGLASVGGLDGSNDGWLVLLCAALAAMGLYTFSQNQRGTALALLAGLAASAVALYDRNRIDNAGPLVQVGWGLNLALISGAAFTITMADWLFR